MSSDQRWRYNLNRGLCLAKAYTDETLILKNDQMDKDFDKLIYGVFSKIFVIALGAGIGIYRIDRHIKRRHHKYLLLKRFTALGIGLSATLWAIVISFGKQKAQFYLNYSQRYESQLLSLCPDLSVLYSETFNQSNAFISDNQMRGQTSPGTQFKSQNDNEIIKQDWKPRNP